MARKLFRMKFMLLNEQVACRKRPGEEEKAKLCAACMKMRAVF